jgi:signal transduction histidine kinase
MANPSSIERDIALISRSNAVPTILEVVARTTGMRFTAVARVTDTHWTACAVCDRIEFGLRPGGELVLKSTICNEIREHRQPIIFGHASKHTVFANHPTPKLYGFESYISIPIFLSDESFFGTLCAIDPALAKIDDPELLKTLQLFAQLIAAQYEAERRSDAAESALLDAQSTARLRDQFVAVLGHDLRNPVQSISMGADMLDRDLPDGRERRIGQLLGNLLSNAITHGSHTSPVRVFILSNASHFELAVENAGKPIAEDAIDRLFQPFTRGTSSSPKPGLGLGLYIAAEIAKAHGGTLQAISNTAFTRFVFRMPLDGDANSLHQGKVEDMGA